MTSAMKSRKSTKAFVAAYLVIIALLYAGVLSVYDPGGSLSAPEVTVPNADLVMEVDLVALDATNQTATIRLHILDIAPNLRDANGRTLNELRIAVWSNLGAEEAVISAGSVLGRVETQIGVEGDEGDYPLDRYTSRFVVDALLVSPDPSVPARPLVIQPLMVGGASGWASVMEQTIESGGWVTFDLESQRAFSTRFFAISIVAMGFVIAMFSFIVGVRVLSGHNSVDSSILGWGAAMIFSLLALRTYMPGDPTIGVAVDLYAYLWIMVFAFAGATMTVFMWLRKART